MKGGFMGRELRIDLSKKRVIVQNLDKQAIRLFAGGSGLASITLYEDLKPKIDPLGPENEIIFSVGPFVGSGVIAGNRTIISGKSPLTGTYCRCHGGGFFGSELKSAGYDGIVITGRAEEPVYIWINDDDVEIRDAKHLWGKSVWEADDIIKEEMGNKKIKTACIGPAGENLCRFACFILNRWDAPARGGMGCVAGSKRLKAIAVRGTKKVPVANPDKVRDLNQEVRKVTSETPRAGIWKDFGTIFLIYQNYSQGVFAARNYQENNWAKAPGVSPWLWTIKYRVKGTTCFACPIFCRGVYEVKYGRFKGVRGEKLEFGTIMALGAQLDIADYGGLCYLQNLISQHGMDSMELGFALSMAMECYEKGILSKSDMGGIELKWGNVEAVIEMIKNIVYRKGFGNTLAEGVKRASELIGRGAEKFAMQSKGLSLDGVDVRASQSWALGHAVGRRGPDHLEHFEVISRRGDRELAKKLLGTEESADMYSPEAKGRVIWWGENYKSVMDALGLCVLFTNTILAYHPISKIAQTYTAVTGIEMDGVDLMTCGERIIQMERAFNAREGVSREGDTLPLRLLKEPASEGAGKGLVAKLDHPGMLDEYYDYRGCDCNGLPTRDRLEEIGLSKIADDLAKYGKISTSTPKIKFSELTQAFQF